jgi:sulfur dioxygenase
VRSREHGFLLHPDTDRDELEGIVMSPIQLFDPISSTYTYLVYCETTRQAVIIDPVDGQLNRDLDAIENASLTVLYAIETHAHADHITSAGLLAEHIGARTAAPSGCGISTAAIQLRDGDEIRFGQETLRALHTPGHTSGSMCFLWREHVFTGDTLLINGCGRTDFQSGSAELLYHSLTQILFHLPDATIVWPGHDYQGRTHSTIGTERSNNARVAGKSQAEFIAIMAGLNLPKPARIDEAVPANQASGLTHDSNGGYIESPEVGQVRAAEGYAGDVSPHTAYAWWQAGDAVLVDVRTDAEREWVGFVPGAIALPWKQWPGMAMNDTFDADIATAAQAGKKLVLLCRSGVRSIAAARRATSLGLSAYNILEGFEGEPDINAHRGSKGGWRYRKLPWRQH